MRQVTVMRLVLFYGVFMLSGLIASGVCVYKFAHCDFKAPYKAEVLYGIGIVPPIGLVMAWIPINDGTN